MPTPLPLPDSDSDLDRALAGGWAPGRELRRRLTLVRSWREPADTLHLEACYRLEVEAGRQRLRAVVAGHDVPLDAPVRLAPVSVAKPWGREIWFTGIEARGESGVVSAAGTLPLSQYLALAPGRLIGGRPLVLLKILDPSPEPVRGDLYFEAHREKQEVYVVSHVDRGAWPDGRGGIRYGMNQALRRRYGDDEAFRRDYLAAVSAYERVRRAIDAGEPASPAEEAERRAAMEAFTHLRPLAVGDVVVVPTWLPHALQHGVRVVEFQTPTYERYIISFAQRVVTQAHWDSADAVPRMRLDQPAPPAFEAVAPGVERIVRFDDFRVWRIRLAPGAELTLPAHPSYGVCMAVEGTARLGALRLAPEQAALVPGTALAEPAEQRPTLSAVGGPVTVLLAAPDL